MEPFAHIGELSEVGFARIDKNNLSIVKEKKTFLFDEGRIEQ